MPCTPLPARRWGWSRKASSEATLWSATSQTSPPLPPSPPLGPAVDDRALPPERHAAGAAVAAAHVRAGTRRRTGTSGVTLRTLEAGVPVPGGVALFRGRNDVLLEAGCRRLRQRHLDRLSDRPIQERAERWAATMAGTRDGRRIRSPTRGRRRPVRAVDPPPARSARTSCCRRSAPAPRCRRPAVATRSPTPWRTCFERDRDRILHAAAFRRLAGKTQVFVFPDDHQRTRLTHALEVAQVATSVARALGLNVALTEAIALGHDCGHGPGGHASEDALSPYVDGGYDHAVWGADVTLAPLNLCAETLDGIRNHSWSRPAPATPEGEVVSWADRIAYVCHDFEDAVAAGIVTPDLLPPVVVERCGRPRAAARRVHRGRWSTPPPRPAASA